MDTRGKNENRVIENSFRFCCFSGKNVIQPFLYLKKMHIPVTGLFGDMCPLSCLKTHKLPPTAARDTRNCLSKVDEKR